jgi:hypothetical protein
MRRARTAERLLEAQAEPRAPRGAEGE